MRDSLDILQTEDSIAHYGVMGMKWGVRKQRAAAAGMSVRDYKKQIKADNKEAWAIKICDMMDNLTEVDLMSRDKLERFLFKKAPVYIYY
jgi:hypothetical protein